MTLRPLRDLRPALLSAFACIVLLAAPCARAADSLAVVDPLPPPAYGVGCSNIAQDFSRVGAGESAQNYWEGYPADNGRGRYMTDLLGEPANAVIAVPTVPDDRELFDGGAGQQIPFAVLVCYPTSASNPYPDYALPDGKRVPHMQVGSAPPLWPDASTRWPVLIFSHGLTGSPISGDYLTAMLNFAAYGYVVVAPFHGDPRFANVRLDNLSDALEAIRNFSSYTELQALRAVSASAALSAVLAHPQFRDRVDPQRVGGFGASLGGEGLLLAVGARLTSSIGLSSKTVQNDTRIKAVVGYVPYFGQSILPAFGRDQHGMEDVAVPVLAIAGTADTTAPLRQIDEGMNMLAGSRELVTLEGVGHGFDVPSTADIFTWSVTFLDAHARDDRLARAKLARMTQVRGGGDDRVQLDYTAPAGLAPNEREVVEFRNDALDHYFLTAEPAEAAMLDAGVIVPGWRRTGFDFKGYAVGAGIGLPTCRFFGTPGLGPNSHFYTIDAAECAQVRQDPLWLFEGLSFAEDAPAADDCAAGKVPVMRLYNNGMGGQASHRFLTSHSEAAAMVRSGWLLEGNVFCAAP